MFWVLGIGDSLSLFRALLIAFWHFCIRSVLNLTSDRRLLPEEEMKLNTHTRGWWGKEKKKKKSSPQEQTAWEFCQLACLWERVKSSGQSYFNTLAWSSKAAGGAAQRKLWERFSEAENFSADWQHHHFTPAGTLTTLGSMRTCVMAQAEGGGRGFLSFTGYVKWCLNIKMPRLSSKIGCHE